MNEVITRLNEIEEKANSIMEGAKAKKMQMEERLVFEKKEFDARLKEEERARAEGLAKELRKEAEQELVCLREKNRNAIAGLNEYYEKNEERLAEEIFRKIIG